MAGGLLTDLYELNMAASYFRRDMAGEAVFSLFVRELPPTRGFPKRCWGLQNVWPLSPLCSREALSLADVTGVELPVVEPKKVGVLRHSSWLVAGVSAFRSEVKLLISSCSS